MRRGKSPDAAIAHLDPDARARALTLVQMILLADLQMEGNPRPLVAAVLESPLYLEALKRYQHDAGFTSQEATINGILRAIAVRYGLVDEQDAASAPRIVKLRSFAPD